MLVEKQRKHPTPHQMQSSILWGQLEYGNELQVNQFLMLNFSVSLMAVECTDIAL